MKMLFNENLVIVDKIPWVQKFLAQSMREIKQCYVMIPSSCSMKATLPRFTAADRIIIHWESNHRHGGAVIEEIKEWDSHYPISSKIIVVTTNPRPEDIYYLSEVGVSRVVRLAQNKPGFTKATQEIRQHMESTFEPSPLDRAWQKIQYFIDRVKNQKNHVNIEMLEGYLDKLHKRSLSKPTARYYDALASIQYFRGYDDRAVMLWSRALEINPNFIRASESLIEFYQSKNQYDLAIRLIQNLNIRNKNSITRMIQLGQIHRKIDQDGKAEHYFKLALEKDKYSSRALNGLAEIRFDQGRFDDARHLLKRSDQSKETASYLNKKGIDLVRKSKFAEALSLYRNAQYVLPLQEKGPMLFFNMGLCYSRWGKVDQARNFLRLALIKKPDYLKARQLLDKIDGISDDTAMISATP